MDQAVCQGACGGGWEDRSSTRSPCAHIVLYTSSFPVNTRFSTGSSSAWPSRIRRVPVNVSSTDTNCPGLFVHGSATGRSFDP